MSPLPNARPDPMPDSMSDVLLTHAAGLRALVRGLLADEHAAEDVLQETWVAAIEHGPATTAPMGGWLRRVARNLALKKRRGDGRRVARERGASRGERLASTDEVLAERESLRNVVDAVFGLDEPYQTAVLMRYFQNRTPREIAARLGVPVATVDSQLHRARAKLREHLDEAAGGKREQWALALATATGWSGEAAVSAGPIGGLSMQWKLLAGAASVAAVAAGATAWSGADDGEESLATARTAEAQELRAIGYVDAPQAPAGDDGAANGSTRVPVKADPTAEVVRATSESTPRFDYVLEGLVVDGDDLPAHGARFYLAPEGQPLNFVQATGGDGSFRVAWKGKAPRMSAVVYAGVTPWGANVLKRVEFEAGTNQLRLALHSEVVKRMRRNKETLVRSFSDDDSEETRKAKVEMELVERMMAAARTQAPPHGEKIRLLEGPFGARFRWPTPQALERQNAAMGYFGPDVAVRATEVRRAADRERQFELDLRRKEMELKQRQRDEELRDMEIAEKKRRAEAQVEPIVLRGTVHGASGEPAGGAQVRLVDAESGKPATSDRVERDGSFELKTWRTGKFELRAGGGDFGLAAKALTVTEEDRGREIVWEPLLDRGREIAGAVVDEAGRPLAEYVVELEGSDGWGDVTVARDGRFAIPNVPGGGRLLLFTPGHASPFPVHVVDGVIPDTGPIEIEIPAAALATGAVEVLPPEAMTESDPLDVRLWHEASGRGVWMRWSEEHGAFRLDGVPVGTYRAVAGSLGRGYADLGAFEVVPGKTTSLGAVATPALGSVAWGTADDGPSEGAVWMLLRRGDAVDHVVDEGVLLEPFTDPLPSGDYLLAIEGVDFAVPAVPFDVRSGEETRVDPALAAHREVVIHVRTELEETPRLTLFTEDGERVHTSLFEGALRLHLPVGSYRAVAEAGSGHAELSFVVAGEDSVQVEIELE